MEEVWDTYNFDDYDDEPNELALNIGSYLFLILVPICNSNDLTAVTFPLFITYTRLTGGPIQFERI